MPAVHLCAVSNFGFAVRRVCVRCIFSTHGWRLRVLGGYIETGWKVPKAKAAAVTHTRVFVVVRESVKSVFCGRVCVCVCGWCALSILVCLQSRGCISSALRVSGLQQCHLLSCFDSDSARLTHCWFTGRTRARRGWRRTPTRPLTCKEKTRN